MKSGNTMELVKNQEYKRSKLHDYFGGSRQSGISPSAKTDIIFIFSANTGEQYGYYDGWRDDERFYYSGEGQLGDQEFERGNKALVEHIENNKRVLLMKESARSHVRYEADLMLVDYSYIQTHDKNGDNRRGILFVFEKVLNDVAAGIKTPSTPMPYRKPTVTERTGLVTTRVGQGWYRQALLRKFNSRCAATELDIPEVLIASHIVPWRSANEVERLDEENGILLSPNYDALFDKHLISFQDTGEILISDKLSSHQIIAMGINPTCKINVSEGMKPYLQKHREELRKS